MFECMMMYMHICIAIIVQQLYTVAVVKLISYKIATKQNSKIKIEKTASPHFSAGKTVVFFSSNNYYSK